MGALYLKDLADKTRRRLRGRVEAGRSRGGNFYGYDVVVDFSGAGEPARGERRINQDQAVIARHIFEAYAAGKSPNAIAHALNKQKVPGPSGKAWGPSTINGKLAARHRHPEQRALCRPAGVEPAELYQEPRYRQARRPAQPGDLRLST
jgi:DNA invertase Pin-like site-specific DNA recombinase